MHRTTRSISIAAAVITVGALALPVSAAIAATDTSSSDGSAVPTTSDPTTSPSPDDPTTSPSPDVEESTAPPAASDADQTDVGESDSTDATETDNEDGDDSTSPTTTAPQPSSPATPWHVKARLLDADSAIVSWWDADAGDTSFSVTLVPFGSATASALPAVTVTGSVRSVQLDGLAAGARYRATVTATTTAGSAISAPSNVVVAPKAKHTKVEHSKAAHTEHAKTAHATKKGASATTVTHGSKAVASGKRTSHRHH